MLKLRAVENKCPLCGKINPNTEWYCESCGAKLPLHGNRAQTEQEPGLAPPATPTAHSIAPPATSTPSPVTPAPATPSSTPTARKTGTGWIWGVGLLAAVFLIRTGCGGGGTISAAKTNVRLEPWTNPDGKQLKMVYFDWKNTGTTPIRALHANMTFYDAQGAVVDKVKNYTIYVAPGNDKGIAPGESYFEPKGEGFAAVDLPGNSPIVRVEGDVTNPEKQSSLDKQLSSG